MFPNSCFSKHVSPVRISEFLHKLKLVVAVWVSLTAYLCACGHLSISQRHVQYQCSAAMSQQQRQVLPENNGGDLKTDFPLSLRFDVEAASVLPCNKIYNTACFGTLKCTMPDAGLLIAA
jgi:hypothetical protein